MFLFVLNRIFADNAALEMAQLVLRCLREIHASVGMELNRSRERGIVALETTCRRRTILGWNFHTHAKSGRRFESRLPRWHPVVVCPLLEPALTLMRAANAAQIPSWLDVFIGERRSIQWILGEKPTLAK